MSKCFDPNYLEPPSYQGPPALDCIQPPPPHRRHSTMKSIKCKRCKEPFTPTEHWMKECEDCWRDGYGKTTSADDSEHPALVYEREHADEQTVGYTDNHELVARCIEQAKAGLAAHLDPEPEQVREPLAWLDCGHPDGFSGTDMTQCPHCGIWWHQWNAHLQEVANHARIKLDASEAAEGEHPLGFG